MKRILAVLALLALTAAPVLADETEAITKAKTAASAWLALADNGDGAGSWETAASMFKAAIDNSSWQKSLAAARTPLGKLKTRQLRSADFAKSVPGGPDGQYVILRYDSQFADKAAATETVTPMLDKDGTWRVSGYYIK